MSVKVMGWVWDQDLPPNLKYVLLAYADHADHYGRRIFPSINLIAEKTGYSRRNVQRVTKELIELGMLIPQGKSRFNTNLYSVPYGGDKVAPPEDEGVTPDTQGGVICDMGGDKLSENVSQMSPEPSFKPSVNRNINRHMYSEEAINAMREKIEEQTP